MSDTKLLLTIEAQKKSVFLSAVMNFFIPGSANIFCGEKTKGIVFFIVAMVLYAVFINMNQPELCTLFAIGAAIGGAVIASKYNKKIIMEAVTADAAKTA